MKVNFKLIWVLLIFNVAFADVITLDPNRRIEVAIGAQVMNRLTVLNDRILNIFGEEEAFTFQADEQTGQVFIKALPDNTSKPIEITLITENGTTQDLTLIPSKTKAATLIFKAKVNSAYSDKQPYFSGYNPSMEDKWLQIMKQAVLGELPVLEKKLYPKIRKINGLETKFSKCYLAGDCKVEVWVLKNTTKEHKILEEKDFKQPGDLCISILNRSLPFKGSTLMYVLGVFDATKD